MAETTTLDMPLQLTIGKVAELLSLSPDTVYKMCYSGEIPSHKRGSRRYVKPGDVQAYIDSLTAPATGV